MNESLRNELDLIATVAAQAWHNARTDEEVREVLRGIVRAARLALGEDAPETPRADRRERVIR
jgi:hypothetical protein